MSNPAEDHLRRRLDSWKAIADYLQRTVRTVQRWERTQGLPVHRHEHGAGASVYAFAPELDAWWFGTPMAATPDAGVQNPAPVRIVILPYADLTGAQDQRHFSHGIIEELATTLGGLSGFVVASPADVHALLARMRPDDVVRTLGGQIRVEGSVRVHGRHLRVSTRVVRTADSQVLRSFQLDGLRSQALALHELVAREVRRALLQPDRSEPQPARTHSSNVNAYSLYLMSRQLWGERTPESLRRSVALANRAVSEDPHYALAHAGVAMGEVALASYVTEPPKAGFERARAAATRALAPDASVPEAHAALGAVSILYDWDTAAADAAFRKAINGNPSHATSWQWYSLVSVARGALEEAIRCTERAAQLEPTSGAIKAHLSWMHYFAGDYARALEVIEQHLEFDQHFARGYWQAAWCHAALGRYQQALRAIEFAVDLADYPTWRAALAHACAIAGALERARSLVRSLEHSSAYVSPYWLAVAQLSIGDAPAALSSLEKAAQHREWFIVTLAFEPLFEALQPTRRFRKLLSLVNTGEASPVS